MTGGTAARRMLLVHAHPDDESIVTGATMAAASAAGVAVTLVTCTRGERGEVIPPELAHLEGDGPALAAHREGELAAAAAALGVVEQLFLDQVNGPARYEDSGMRWAGPGRAEADPDAPPTAFSRSDPQAAAGRLAAVIRRVRPQVVVTYGPGGGYGHPDHVAAHRITARAVELAGAGAPGWSVPRMLWLVQPRGLTAARLAASADGNPFPQWAGDQAPGADTVEDDGVDVLVDGTAHLAAKRAALAAHASQVVLQGDYFALSNRVGEPLTGVEAYRIGLGVPVAPSARPVSDPFAGLGPFPALDTP